VKKIVLPLAAILAASPVWASSNSASKLTFSATALSFNGSSNNVSSQPLTITVTGSQPITITSATYSNGNFSSTPISLPATLPAGQSITGQISARPQSTAQTGVLTIVSSAGTYTVKLTETAASSTTASVNLNWGPPSTGIPTGSYDVDRAENGSTHFSHIGSTPASVTGWTDSSPQAGQTYQYRVRALDHDGDSGPPSNVITLKIP
jgi:predicted phage tail protein